MAEREHLMVFCYDVAKDRTRQRVAEMLEAELARVQRSVFEGRMTTRAAEALGRRAQALMEEGDSLRIYAVTAVGLKHSRAFDKLGLAAPQDYWLV